MRRSTDAGEPTNRELMDRISQVEKALDKVLLEHVQSHALIDSSIGELQRGSILHGERIALIQRELPELDALHDFRIQVQTLSKTAQWIFGGSLLAAVAAVASLILSFSHLLAGT